MSFRMLSAVPNFDFFKPLKFWLAVSILGVLLTIVVVPDSRAELRRRLPRRHADPRRVPRAPRRRRIPRRPQRARRRRADGDRGLGRLGRPGHPDAVGNPENAGEAAAPVADQVKAALDAKFPGVKYLQVDQVGGKVSDELVMTGVLAIGLSLLAIMFYVWLRFEWQFAVGAVVSLFHDVVVASASSPSSSSSST